MYRIHKGFWTLGKFFGKSASGKSYSEVQKEVIPPSKKKFSVEMGKSYLLLRQSGSSKESYSGDRGKVKKLLGGSREGEKVLRLFGKKLLGKS